MAIEIELVECLQELVTEFDRTYCEIADINRGHYNTFFGHVRELENTFYDSATSTAMQLLEKYVTDPSELEQLSDDAR